MQDELLVAYQIAFDLVHNASQQFRGEVRKAIGSGVEADAEQARIQEYYNEMVKKKEEKGASSSSGSDPMQEEKGDVKPVRLQQLRDTSLSISHARYFRLADRALLVVCACNT